MHAKTRTPFSCSLGLALGEVHWDLAADPAEVAPHPTATSSEATRTAARPERLRALPLTDIEVHVTGERGAAPDALRSLAALLRHILASGRRRSTPVEQDYISGYVRQLLLVPSSPFFLDPLQLKAELNCAYLNGDAAQAR